MTKKNGLLPSEEQLDEFFSTEDSEELSEDVEKTPETEGEEQVSLSQEEYDELKKGQMLQSDYTRKRQEESERVRQLERQLAEEREYNKYSESDVNELQADLEDSDLPDSVKQKVQDIDNIKRELEVEREQRNQAEVRRKADEIVSNLKEVEHDYPALKNKAVKFAVMAYASQVLNNSTLKGFKDAAKEITNAYNNEFNSRQQELKKQVKKRRATSPSIGSGGSAPIRTVDAPKSFGEANELVMDALAKMNAIDSR